MVVLKVFGGVCLEGDTGVISGAAAQRHRLALLALLATARAHTMPREKLMELLWPERDDAHVRNLLKQSVYVLRKTLGEGALRAVGDALRLDASLVQCDVIDFEKAVATREFATAVRLYNGPFLDGFSLHAAPEFEDWMTAQRTRLANDYSKALTALAEDAEAQGNTRSATEFWKLLVAECPLDTGATLRLMQAFERAGDPGSALLYAERHERQLKDDLGMRPPAEMVETVARLQGLRPATAVRQQQAPQPAGSATNVAEHVVRSPTPPDVTRRPATRRHLFAPVTALALVAVLVASRFGAEDPEPDATTTTPISLDEIEQVVAEEVDRRLRGDTGADSPARRTASIAAYEAYLRGNDPGMLRSPAAARQALAHFRRAVALDPSYAAAWAGVAKLSMRVSYDDNDNADELMAQSEEAAQRAVELDDAFAEGHAIMGLVHMSRFDLPEAEASIRRSLELDPGRGQTREWLVTLHLWMGKTEQALAEATRAAQLDPLSPSATAELARALAANGRCDDALARLESIADIDPPLLRVPLIEAHCHAERGQWNSAIETLDAANTGSAGPMHPAMLGYVLARSGQQEDASRILDTLADAWRTGDGGAFPVAMLHGGLGDRDQLFVWLERSIEDRSLEASPDQFTMLQPILDQVRGDPRFERLPMLAQWREARDL